jgi:hypothetical protein
VEDSATQKDTAGTAAPLSLLFFGFEASLNSVFFLFFFSLYAFPQWRRRPGGVF